MFIGLTTHITTNSSVFRYELLMAWSELRGFWTYYSVSQMTTRIDDVLRQNDSTKNRSLWFSIRVGLHRVKWRHRIYDHDTIAILWV